MQYNDINTELDSVRLRLDVLSSINTPDLLITSGPFVHYHRIIEEANEALLRAETEVSKLREELTQQHRRLDTMRETELAKAINTEEKILAFCDED